MSRTLPVRIAPHDTPVSRPSRRRVQEIGRVVVFNPRTIGALESAQQLGAPMRCRLDGSTLVVEVER